MKRKRRWWRMEKEKEDNKEEKGKSIGEKRIERIMLGKKKEKN